MSKDTLRLRIGNRGRSTEKRSGDSPLETNCTPKSKRSPEKKVKKPVPRTRTSRLLSFSILLLCAIIIMKHPRTASMASDLLTPAERFLSEIDRWGNFTMTSTIRGAINDVLNASGVRSDPEVPFYSDFIGASSNLSVRHPVLFIPGYITSGLEIWANLPCAKAKFRERIWGTASMVKLFITDPSCWVQHMLLVPVYGNDSVHWADPVGVKIKATSGLASADFLLGDYWVWNPIIEALGRVGYDESRMHMMSYDWRVPIRDLEVRDRFMTRLKLEIESM